MNALNTTTIRSFSIPFATLAALFALAVAPGVSMAGHQSYGEPDAEFALSETTTGQVGSAFLWFVDDADPNSNPITDPLLKTNFFLEIYIPSWLSHPETPPGINAQGHLVNLPESIRNVLYRDADFGFAAPLSQALGGWSATFGADATDDFEYLGLFSSGGVAAIAPIDVDNMMFDDKGLAAPMYEVHPIRQGRSDGCVPNDAILCLNDGRFKVEAEWKDFFQNSGEGRVLPGGTDDQGAFWFFNPSDMGVLVKVLDHCSDPFSSFWVFASATTNVEYTVTVTDTQTGVFKEYTNPLGAPAEAITDTQAFATCP